MNSFSYYRITSVHSFKYYILSTFLCHKAGTLQDTIIILFGVAMLLALRWPLLHQIFASIFAQCTFARAKAMRAPSMQTDRLMTSSRGQASTSRLTRPK